ncbi:hypothetical protein RRG08_032641 [Elysia crispata]|uniref:Uncharacterized protein n=1 Tax=Elysia crispata TaxID=231223 RepID=A0AAE1CPZ7_9GAST|nr:hypothetical protein RRG08_032641 [Elysia crispata]
MGDARWLGVARFCTMPYGKLRLSYIIAENITMDPWTERHVCFVLEENGRDNIPGAFFFKLWMVNIEISSAYSCDRHLDFDTFEIFGEMSSLQGAKAVTKPVRRNKCVLRAVLLFMCVKSQAEVYTQVETTNGIKPARFNSLCTSGIKRNIWNGGCVHVRPEKGKNSPPGHR